jgi:putative peptidoglycan lipid II flippase
MARLAAENQIQEMNRLLNRTLKYLSLIIPFSMLLMVLRHEVVQILFERGRFDAAATAQTSGILVYLMIGAVAFAAQTVVVRGYYAVQNTLFPAIYSTLGVIISLPLYMLGMKLMGASGVALAISISAILQVIFLYVLWNRRSINPESREVYMGYVKMLLISLPAGLILEGLRMGLARWIGMNGLAGSLLIASGIGLLFMFLLFVTGYLFKIREITETLGRIFKKAI